jgi:ferredoxin
MNLIFPFWWHVEFPRVVNVPAMMELYAALPEVDIAEPNWYGGIACVVFDTWMYSELPGGTWRWTILDRDMCGGFGCCETRWDVAVTAAGSAQVVCAADCNGDGALAVSDFGCFQTAFVAGAPYADCNGDGALTVADFGCFQTAFVAGCL